MKRVLKIDTLEQFKAIMEPIRRELFNTFDEEEFTVKDISEKLGESPAKINYHVKEMTKTGFFIKTKTRKVRNLIEQYYQKSARSYAVSAKFNTRLAKLPNEERKELSDNYFLNFASLIHDSIIDFVNTEDLEGKSRSQKKESIIGLNTAIYVSEKDLKEIGREIDKIINKYGKKRSKKNKQKLFILSLPYQN